MKNIINFFKINMDIKKILILGIMTLIFRISNEKICNKIEGINEGHTIAY